MTGLALREGQADSKLSPTLIKPRFNRLKENFMKLLTHILKQPSAIPIISKHFATWECAIDHWENTFRQKIVI